jgi:hypothetical protein
MPEIETAAFLKRLKPSIALPTMGTTPVATGTAVEDVMRVDNEQRRFQTSAVFRLQAPGILGKLVTLAAGATVLAAAVTVSLLVFAVVLAGGLLAWSYPWWRTREWRKQMARQSGGRVIRAT